MCEHEFAYAGVRYCDGEHSMPGTGARARYYAHVYFCTKCTETIGRSIKSPRDCEGRPIYNSYQKPQFGASPGTAAECGVPLEDQSRR